MLVNTFLYNFGSNNKLGWVMIILTNMKYHDKRFNIEVCGITSELDCNIFITFLENKKRKMLYNLS